MLINLSLVYKLKSLSSAISACVHNESDDSTGLGTGIACKSEMFNFYTLAHLKTFTILLVFTSSKKHGIRSCNPCTKLDYQRKPMSKYVY